MVNWITPEIIAIKREALESIYHYRMTVYDIRQVYNPETGFDEPQETIIYKDQPCRLSTQITDPTDDNPTVFTQKTNLICAPELDIPAGCRIEVDCYNGVKKSYQQVSKSRSYSDHQTLIMREFTREKGKYA